jgi:hypothetical protein
VRGIKGRQQPPERVQVRLGNGSRNVVRPQGAAHVQEHVGEVRRRLVRREPEISGAGLDKLAARSETRQRQGRIRSARDHLVKLWGEMATRNTHPIVDLARIDDVVVVEHDLVGRALSSLTRVAMTTSIDGWLDCRTDSAPAPTPGAALCSAPIT